MRTTYAGKRTSPAISTTAKFERCVKHGLSPQEVMVLWRMKLTILRPPARGRHMAEFFMACFLSILSLQSSVPTEHMSRMQFSKSSAGRRFGSWPTSQDAERTPSRYAACHQAHEACHAFHALSPTNIVETPVVQLLINEESMGCRDDGVLGRGAEKLQGFTLHKHTLHIRTYRYLFPPINP